MNIVWAVARAGSGPRHGCVMAKSSALGQALPSRASGEVKQLAEKVVNFSSQYGTDGSASYVAANLAGDLRVYNKYGDFVEAFVLVCLQLCRRPTRNML